MSNFKLLAKLTSTGVGNLLIGSKYPPSSTNTVVNFVLVQHGVGAADRRYGKLKKIKNFIALV